MRIKPLPTTVTVALAAFFLAMSSPATTNLAGMQKGKPQPPPPTPSTYSATLGASIHNDAASTGNEADYPDHSQDGLKSPGHLFLPAVDLTGSIAGPNRNGNFTGTLGGNITGLVISHVDELPDWFDGGNPCQENEVATLRDLGLVGSALNGTLDWRFGELAGSLKGNPRIDWRLDGVMDARAPAGHLWETAAARGLSSFQSSNRAAPRTTSL